MLRCVALLCVPASAMTLESFSNVSAFKDYGELPWPMSMDLGYSAERREGVGR